MSTLQEAFADGAILAVMSGIRDPGASFNVLMANDLIDLVKSEPHAGIVFVQETYRAIQEKTMGNPLLFQHATSMMLMAVILISTGHLGGANFVDQPPSIDEFVKQQQEPLNTDEVFKGLDIKMEWRDDLLD